VKSAAFAVLDAPIYTVPACVSPGEPTRGFRGALTCDQMTVRLARDSPFEIGLRAAAIERAQCATVTVPHALQPCRPPPPPNYYP
jgi:hypothetical protein